MANVQVTFDAGDPHALCDWWAALLGYEVEDGHDLVTKLLADGVISEGGTLLRRGRRAFADGAAAHDPAGEGPRLYFQLVPEAKTAKNRVHLDVSIRAGAGLDEEVERLQAEGATFVGFNSQPSHRWAVMADPEGNEFCVR